jgi:pimeloyl-ACP methyl ester carboxylesterase
MVGMKTPPRLSAPARTLTLALALVAALAAGSAAQAAEQRPGLKACRLSGVEHEAWCGVLRRPLDPQKPDGLQFDLHYAVLPALARNRKPDPVLFFAGGPGQSAIELAGPVSRMMARLSNRRDVVLVDQRGTGRSAPLRCAEELPTRPLAESASPEALLVRIRACRETLQKLPHGDLRLYTTSLAMQDADAVRRALGAAQVNLVGGSYGTRAALEYQRQFPAAVRRSVIDGVAPPDMVLPASFSTDNQAALDAVLAACEAEAACRGRYPRLRDDWRSLLAGLPRAVDVQHPVTGQTERITVSRDTLLNLARGPLYAPVLASALPAAITDAAQGRFQALLGLSVALFSGRNGAMAEGMHFSVVCAEDAPRVAQSRDVPGADYGDSFARTYQQVCADWPRGEVPPAFYTLPASRTPVLLLSGGADPVTPPRHAERVAQALGAQARHVVVPQAGHGVMGIGCMRDVVFRFIDAPTDAEALKVDVDCARALPRPPAFLPVSAASAASAVSVQGTPK